MLKRTCIPFYTKRTAFFAKQGEQAMRAGQSELAAQCFRSANAEIAQAKQRHEWRGGRKPVRSAGR